MVYTSLAKLPYPIPHQHQLARHCRRVPELQGNYNRMKQAWKEDCFSFIVIYILQVTYSTTSNIAISSADWYFSLLLLLCLLYNRCSAFVLLFFCLVLFIGLNYVFPRHVFLSYKNRAPLVSCAMSSVLHRNSYRLAILSVLLSRCACLVIVYRHRSVSWFFVPFFYVNSSCSFLTSNLKISNDVSSITFSQ